MAPVQTSSPKTTLEIRYLRPTPESMIMTSLSLLVSEFEFTRNRLFQIAPANFFVRHLSWIFTGLIAVVCIIFVPSHDTCFLSFHLLCSPWTIPTLRLWTPSSHPLKPHLWHNPPHPLLWQIPSLCHPLLPPSPSV